VALAVPFLQENWWGYVSKAFELSRVFFFKWTVNFKFLPEEVFVSKPLALALLAAHLLLLGVLLHRAVGVDGGWRKALSASPRVLSPAHITWVMMATHFVGVALARTLHYQFYCWYFHTLPLLLWSTDLWHPLRVMILVGIEVAFNVFPATPISSALLQVCHLLLLVALLRTPVPSTHPPKSKVAPPIEAGSVAAPLQVSSTRRSARLRARAQKKTES
jgi:alpha-1,3-mannosyltransferase